MSSDKATQHNGENKMELNKVKVVSIDDGDSSITFDNEFKRIEYARLTQC